MSDTDTDDDILVLDTETLQGDIRDFLLDHLPEGKLDNYPEWKQESLIAEATRQAKRLIKGVADIIRAADCVSVDVLLEQVVVKDGLKATVSCPRTNAALDHLGHAQGGTVSLVFLDTSGMMGQRCERKATPDQKTLLTEDNAVVHSGPEDGPQDAPPPDTGNTPEAVPDAAEGEDGPKDEPEVAQAKRRRRK